MQIRLGTKSRAISRSAKRQLHPKSTNCPKTKLKSKANALVRNTKTIHKERLVEIEPKL